MFRTGEFAQKHWDALEAAGAFSGMEQLAEQVRALGFEVRSGHYDHIPSASNGEAGFIVSAGPIKLMVFRRATSDALRLAVAGRAVPDYRESAALLEQLGFGPLDPRQIEKGQARYYLFPGLPQRHPPEQVLELLASIATRLRRETPESVDPQA